MSGLSLRRGLAVAVSALLIALLTGLVVLLQTATLTKEETVVVREVTLAPPPPPPPPTPPLQQAQPQSLSLELGTTGQGAAVTMGELNLDIGMDFTKIEPPPVADTATQFLQDSLSMAFDDLFALNELDRRPRLLTDLTIQFPKALRRKGVRRVEVEAEVIIDTDGKVVLKAIRHASHPEIKVVFKKLMARARFTAPRKDGVPVRASFNWPLEFNDNR